MVDCLLHNSVGEHHEVLLLNRATTYSETRTISSMINGTFELETNVEQYTIPFEVVGFCFKSDPTELFRLSRPLLDNIVDPKNKELN